MDRTKVMDLADNVGGLFRLTVLLQKRVRELINGAPKLVETSITDPINIAMLEVEEGAIELVDLSDEELKVLEAESQMASEEAEILEALRSRVTTRPPAKSSTKPPAKAPAKAAKAATAAVPADGPPADPVDVLAPVADGPPADPVDAAPAADAAADGPPADPVDAAPPADAAVDGPPADGPPADGPPADGDASPPEAEKTDG